MKKYVAVLLFVLASAVFAAGCGDGGKAEPDGAPGTEQAESTEPAGSQKKDEPVVSESAAFDLKGADYVTLCDYSRIEVTINGDYEVTDADVTEYLDSLLADYGPFYTDDPEKTTVEEGDIVDVDYVGKKDGVAFDRGSAEHQLIDVSNNSSVDGSRFIDGFAEGLLGASVGDTIDCDVTFPDNYGNEELAGEPVVFTFTVNSIQKVMTAADVDDAFAQEQFEAETVEEMNGQLRSYLEDVADYSREEDIYYAVQDYLIANCEVDIPEDYLTARLNDYRRQFIDQNCGGDESQLESFLGVYYGQSVEEMEEYWAGQGDRSIRLELIMDAIADELAVTVDDGECQEYAERLASGSGYASAEDMYPVYGYGDAVYGEASFKRIYRYDRALDEVIGTAIVHVNGAKADAGGDEAGNGGTGAGSGGTETADGGTEQTEHGGD